VRPTVTWQSDKMLTEVVADTDYSRMRKTLHLIALGSAFSAVACSDPASPLDNVTVTVSASSSVIRGNETTEIVTSFQNTGWRDVLVPSRSCGPWFTVRNKEGAFLALGPEACLADAPLPLRLAPGERAQFTGTWDGRDRFGIRTPGDYRITAGIFGGNAVVVRVLD
jgi:hypothetical protein